MKRLISLLCVLVLSGCYVPEAEVKSWLGFELGKVYTKQDLLEFDPSPTCFDETVWGYQCTLFDSPDTENKWGFRMYSLTVNKLNNRLMMVEGSRFFEAEKGEECLKLQEQISKIVELTEGIKLERLVTATGMHRNIWGSDDQWESPKFRGVSIECSQSPILDRPWILQARFVNHKGGSPVR